MKSALNIVAFAKASKEEGITALLETALAALDTTDLRLATIYVDLALHHIMAESKATSADDGLEISEFG